MLNRVHEHFFDFELAFAAVDARGDARELLHVLNIGVSARELHQSGVDSSADTDRERL